MMQARNAAALVERLAQGNVARMARGQVKLSLMAPGINVLPHCGPTNARIRMHLGLQVPEGITFKVGGEDARVSRVRRTRAGG